MHISWDILYLGNAITSPCCGLLVIHVSKERATGSLFCSIRLLNKLCKVLTRSTGHPNILQPNKQTNHDGMVLVYRVKCWHCWLLCTVDSHGLCLTKRRPVNISTAAVIRAGIDRWQKIRLDLFSTFKTGSQVSLVNYCCQEEDGWNQ